MKSLRLRLRKISSLNSPKNGCGGLGQHLPRLLLLDHTTREKRSGHKILKMPPLSTIRPELLVNAGIRNLFRVPLGMLLPGLLRGSESSLHCECGDNQGAGME